MLSSSNILKRNDYRLPLAVLLIIGLALSFWLSSRYPALSEKAEMGGDTPLSGLSFDMVVDVLPDSSFLWLLFANTINWLSTNLQGMSFGVLFGAAALTVMSLLKKRSFNNSFANSALGAAIGAPLGVCVNCAAPIALGLHAGRARLETTLSALLASPTLNVIVVTMSFALLPFHIAAVKLGIALLLVLVAIPLLCQFVLKEETLATHDGMAKLASATESKGFAAWISRVLAPREMEQGEFNPAESIRWIIRNYARNFFFVFIVTVPLMFMAALLGALIASFVSASELTYLLPRNSIPLVLFSMVIVALIASFVPAPIALDVILVVILMGIGLPSQYSATILIALGSYSVYAFFIIWKAISLRTAISIWIMVIGASIAGGVFAYGAHRYNEQFDKQGHLEALKDAEAIVWPELKPLPKAKSVAELRPLLETQMAKPAIVPLASVSGTSANISVTQTLIGWDGPEAAANGIPFSRIAGPEIGLAEPDAVSSLGKSTYYSMRGGIAAGDIHGDGWPDIVTRRSTLTTGLSIYANVGGKFVLQAVDLGPVGEHEILNVALVDIDGDSALDLVVATFGKGNFLFYNDGGGDFAWGNHIELPNADSFLSYSMAFADMDQDGDIDVIQGNWAPPLQRAGLGADTVSDKGRNYIAWNDGNREFTPEILSMLPGQTLSLLVSDIDRDGSPDLVHGDDVAPTDAITYFDKAGKHSQRGLAGQVFPYMTMTSMSYDEGDWNNDLKPDYYGGQITPGKGRRGGFEKAKSLAELCATLAKEAKWTKEQASQCIGKYTQANTIGGGYNSRVFGKCKSTSNPNIRTHCSAQQLIATYFEQRPKKASRKLFKECRNALQKLPRFQRQCIALLDDLYPLPRKEERDKMLAPILNRRNLLLTATADGKFEEQAKSQSVDRPGWTWNSRFADLDQNGWQDLLVMTGIWAQPQRGQTNRFYLNRDGKFSDETESFGFTDVTPSFSFVTLDYDRDGDIDVIRGLSGLHMITHRNDKPAGRGLWVNLRDRGMNSMGIGAYVTICVDGAQTVAPGKCQMRPVRASGGFSSFDPIAAHFGLGNAKTVSLIQVKWPDGDVSTIMPEALSGGEITIRRN